MIAFVDKSTLRFSIGWKRLLEGDAILVRSNYVLVETCALVQHRLGLDAIRSFQQQIASVLTSEWISPAQA